MVHVKDSSIYGRIIKIDGNFIRIEGITFDFNKDLLERVYS